MDLPRIWSRLGWVIDIPSLRRAYIHAFYSGPGKDEVLPDLAEFCHATTPAPIGADALTFARYEGRRDVWLHIREMLDLSDDELAVMLRSRSVAHTGV